MLDGDEIILERLCFLFGAGEHVVERLRHVDFRGVDAARDLRQALQLAVHGQRKRGGREAKFVDDTGDQPVLLREQRGKQVPGVHLVMVEPAGDVLRVGDSLTRHLGEFGGVHNDYLSHALRQIAMG